MSKQEKTKTKIISAQAEVIEKQKKSRLKRKTVHERTKEEWKEIEVGALWENVNGDGVKTSYGGNVEILGEKIDIFCLPNPHKKEGDNRPSIRIYLSTPKDE